VQSSKLSLQHWTISTYMVTTGVKGASSMKLHRELKITQKSAWFMIQRLREIFVQDAIHLVGTLEEDEAYMGGKRMKMHDPQRR